STQNTGAPRPASGRLGATPLAHQHTGSRTPGRAQHCTAGPKGIRTSDLTDRAWRVARSIPAVALGTNGLAVDPLSSDWRRSEIWSEFRRHVTRCNTSA